MDNKLYQNNIFSATQHYGRRVDKKGNGVWIGSYSNGELWYISSYTDGKLNGLLAEYNPKGFLEKISFYII